MLVILRFKMVRKSFLHLHKGIFVTLSVFIIWIFLLDGNNLREVWSDELKAQKGQ
ncbi:MAG: hypothetical protein U0X39_04020 [Bacteroidales bacterium]